MFEQFFAAIWQLGLAILPVGRDAALVFNAFITSGRNVNRDELKQQLHHYSTTAYAWIIRFVQLCLTLTVLFSIASFIYGVFYYIMLPSRLHEQEIFFNYGNHIDTLDANRNKPMELSLPKATLDLLDPVRQWESLTIEAVVPVSSKQQQKSPQTSLLQAGMNYDVMLEFVMPETTVNEEIGMFMVSTKLYSQNKSTPMAKSERPLRLRAVHPLIQSLKMLLWSFPYVLGISEPTQTISTTVINGFYEQSPTPLVAIEFQLSHPRIQIYSAKLTIITQLTGVRYYMYHWRLVTATLVITNIVLLEIFALILAYGIYMLPQLQQGGMDLQFDTLHSKLSGSDIDIEENGKSNGKSEKISGIESTRSDSKDFVAIKAEVNFQSKEATVAETSEEEEEHTAFLANGPASASPFRADSSLLAPPPKYNSAPTRRGTSGSSRGILFDPTTGKQRRPSGQYPTATF